jgi:hypothetical protein
LTRSAVIILCRKLLFSAQRNRTAFDRTAVDNDVPLLIQSFSFESCGIEMVKCRNWMVFLLLEEDFLFPLTFTQSDFELCLHQLSSD